MHNIYEIKEVDASTINPEIEPGIMVETIVGTEYGAVKNRGGKKPVYDIINIKTREFVCQTRGEKEKIKVLAGRARLLDLPYTATA